VSVAVILPTYCEAENIESLIREIEELDLDLSIAVIDDSSPDGTAKIAKKLHEEYGNIHLISRPEKSGLGTAITEGFEYLISQKRPPRYIVAMDADYSHNPSDIPRLVNAAKNNDVVIGSRYIPGGKMLESNMWRRLVSRVANIVATIIVGAGVHDCTSGFRCYSRRYIRKVLKSLHSQTYEIQIETLKQARINGFTVQEIPIAFVNRKRGKSKLSAAEVIAFMTYMLKVILRRQVHLKLPRPYL